LAGFIFFKIIFYTKSTLRRYYFIKAENNQIFTEVWSINDELFETGGAFQTAKNEICRFSGIGSLEAHAR